MDDLPIQAIEREERLSNRVAKRLEELIISGVLKSEEMLPSERELGEMFGVSRTVVREAIHNLAARDLVEIRAGSGSYVMGPTTKSVSEALSLLLRSRTKDFLVDDLHEVRRVLETEIAGLAADRATEEDVKTLEANLRRLADANDAQDHETCANLDVEFHRGLAVGTQNPLFLILLDSLDDLLLAIRRIALQDPATFQKATYHHREILEKVKGGDPLGARTAMSAHLDQSEDTMRGVLRTHGHLQSVYGVLRSQPDAAEKTDSAKTVANSA